MIYIILKICAILLFSVMGAGCGILIYMGISMWKTSYENSNKITGIVLIVCASIGLLVIIPLLAYLIFL